MKSLLKALLLLIPWIVRRHLLILFFNYEIHPSARIGFSWVFPDKLFMGENSSIGHLNVVKGLSSLVLKDHALINRLNWITGHPIGCKLYFKCNKNRSPDLEIGEHAAITNRHLIDCTDRIEIGKYSIIAGFRSQLLTHGIDFSESAQKSSPIKIGQYCFIGTSSVLLKGTVIPDFSVVGAMSLVNKKHSEEWTLYAGVPAVNKATLDSSLAWFKRSVGTTF